MNMLYTLSNGKIRIWMCWAEGSEVIVSHGLKDGKFTAKRYTAEAKNVGRANETTPEQQALLEVEAKVVKQLKSGYFRTEEEAKNYVPFTPMKAQNYKDFAHKVVYPCYMQKKLNGQRLMIDKNGIAWSKQGEPLELPDHWVGVREMAIAMGGLDGEVYAGLVSDGGLSLQDIISAFRKKNENTHKLKFYVYDIPDEKWDQITRTAKLEMFETLSKSENVVIVSSECVESEYEAGILYNEWVEAGYEGAVYRMFDGLYEFGKRSYFLIKRKPRLDAEAKVIGYTLDKNNEPVFDVVAVNGEQTDAQFKLKMKIPEKGTNYRRKENADSLIGQHITYEYEELSDENVPLKPVGIAPRDVNDSGEPLI